MEKIRAFVAVPLPVFLRENLARIQGSLRSRAGDRGVRWANIPQSHLTLAFLGGLDAARVEELADALRSMCAGHAPFRLHAGEVGAFPSAKNPRVLWIGLDGDMEGLQAFQSQMTEVCARFSERTEKRAFIPHVTLARTEPFAGRALLDALPQAPPLEMAAWTVTHAVLMRSVLKPGGAVHAEMARLPLGQC